MPLYQKVCNLLKEQKMEKIALIIHGLDYILFTLLALCAFYLFLFAVLSKFYKPRKNFPSLTKNRFLILFPAYKADYIIVESIKSFLQQDYPKEFYELLVIADGMTDETCNALQNLGATVVTATYSNSSKAKALQLAISTKEEDDFNLVVVMDADNTTTPDFLNQLNDCYNTGARAIQTHRTAKNLNTDIALLDAISEEANNSFFRSGHIVAGLSSGLIGSGMAFDYNWFKSHVSSLQTSGEDKELEAMLLKEKIEIHYLSEVYVFDEKTQRQDAITRQRQRWIAAQFAALKENSLNLPTALLEKNWSYADKIVQWMLPPRLLQIGLIIGWTILISLLGFFMENFSNLMFKWWILSLIQVTTFIIVVPSHLMTIKTLKAMGRVPVLALKVLKSLFHLKGVSKNFIHTRHE